MYKGPAIFSTAVLGALLLFSTPKPAHAQVPFGVTAANSGLLVSLRVGF